jgi:hypothetical protein
LLRSQQKPHAVRREVLLLKPKHNIRGDEGRLGVVGINAGAREPVPCQYLVRRPLLAKIRPREISTVPTKKAMAETVGAYHPCRSACSASSCQCLQMASGSRLARSQLISPASGYPRYLADLHGTSVKQIEKHYAKYITNQADQIARAALLDTSSNKVLPMAA